ncbi:MAG: sigma-70 family RNA polymerase sigma factor [Actinobacteria bacterium]|nr:sigma-70 family RNA polymerase sigma factor [Actinomycetota bacterium]
MAALLDTPTIAPVVTGLDSMSVEALPVAVSDGELIERVAARDHAAFEELHRRYVRAVLGLALRRIGDRGRAEDATQETFTAIWRSASRYDPERGPGAPWLYTVARNTIVNGLRRSPEPAVDAPEEVADAPGPSERAEASWGAWRLHPALETIPAPERRVVELAYWSGLSHSEIAAFLDIPLGTVKTRVRAALRRLAETLESELR